MVSVFSQIAEYLILIMKINTEISIAYETGKRMRVI